MFLAILESKETFTEDRRDLLYQASAKLGILYVTWERYAEALVLLEKASLLDPEGYLRAYIGVDLAYCLHTFGRLQEAEQHLKDVLRNESDDLKADVYYLLGEVQLQTGNCDAAIDSFQNALKHLPYGKIAESDILTALQEAKEQQHMNRIDRPHTSSRPKPRVQ